MRSLPAIVKFFLPFLVAAGAAVSLSCGADSPSGPDVPGPGPIEESELECEQRGYPCSLSEVPLAILERGDALGDEALAMLEGGASTGDAAAFLEGQADMAEVEWDETAIWFRLERGAGLWILREGAFSPEVFTTNAGPARASSYTGPAFDIVAPESEAKRALVLSPFLWQVPTLDDGPTVAAILSATRGYEGRVTFRANGEQSSTEVTLQSFMDWTSYDVVHLTTHGKRICDEGGCRGTLLAGVLGPGTLEENLQFLSDPGVSYAKGETTGLEYIVLNADFFRFHYRTRLDDTLVFFNACQSFGPQATDLVDAVQGAGSVVLGWSETVFVVDATAAAEAFYRALSERGYPAEVAMEHIGELRIGKTVPGFGAPELRLSPRSGGGDLRIRDVVSLLSPGSGQVLTASDLVAIEGTARDDVEDAAPFMVQVDGVKPEFADGMVVQVTIDGVEADPVPLTSGESNDEDQWTVTGTVALGYDLTDDKPVLFQAVVNLHSGGESRHQTEATLTGEGPLMGKVWEMEAAQTFGYFDGTPHSTWDATAALTLELAPGQAPSEPNPRYVVTGGSVTFDYFHTVGNCLVGAGPVTFEANAQTVFVGSEVLFDTTTDPVGYSGLIVTEGPTVDVTIACQGGVETEVTFRTASRWFLVTPEEGRVVSQDGRSISGTYRLEDPQSGIYSETQYTITRVE